MTRASLTDHLRLRLHPDLGAGGGGGGGGAGPIGPEKSKIQIGGPGAEAIESKWKRPLHANGTGATHVRTFTGKLNAAGLDYMDRYINEWLDNHPSAEVKFATMSVGEFSTALGKEWQLVVQVWI